MFQLLGEDRFSAIDKIKTVGSTYMAAVGLIPDKKMADDSSIKKHLATLVEFVFAMRDKLKDINDNSYNNFMLRVGKKENCIITTDIVQVLRFLGRLNTNADAHK